MKMLRPTVMLLALVLPQAALPQDTTDWDQQAATLERNRQLWNSRNIHDYRMLVDRGCMTCNWYFPAKVVVERDEVVAALEPDGDEPKRARTPEGLEDADTPAPSLDLYLTVEVLFDEVERAIENHWGTTHPGIKAEGFSVEYDKYYGYPRLISAGYSRGLSPDGGEFMQTDSGFSYRVLEFSE